MTEQDDQKTRTDRLFQTVAKFTRKITECNKRIDELLRSQKEIKNDIESIEGIIYEQVLKDDKSEAENIDDFGGLTPDKSQLKLVILLNMIIIKEIVCVAFIKYINMMSEVCAEQ